MKIDAFFEKARGEKVENVWEYLDDRPQLWISWYPGGGFAPQPGTGAWSMKVFVGNLQKIEGAGNELKRKYGQRRPAQGYTNTPESKEEKSRKIERRGGLVQSLHT